MYDYDEWAEKHKDTIALCLGITYGLALLIFALIVKYKLGK